ncbi:MAG: cytidine deaminase [Oscillospiraceae bacterium]|nr:cytidine deaminase [Oscillospiraceae bacterium]
MDEKTLLKAAAEAAENAYAPYSGYQVGAAALGEDGRLYTGCNVENASYGLTNCAERGALFAMVGAGCRRFTLLAVCAKGAAAPWPCGACRQVMAEFCQNGDTPVLVRGGDGVIMRSTVGGLLPEAFSLKGAPPCRS